MAEAHIGTSGWQYKHWADGVFYPAGLSPAKWLEYYYRFFDTVEVNNTFYRLPEKHVFEKWRDGTPPHFRFAVKASRFYTHMKRLIDPEKHQALYNERAAGLGRKLDVILFQLPPRFRFAAERLEGLLRYMKRQKLVPGVRCALEVRDASWHCEDCYSVLRRYNVSLVLADWRDVPVTGPLTSDDFVFVRRHGPGEKAYHGNYTEKQLRHDAGLVADWLAGGRDVYMYFNNDPEGHAVRNALRLKELLKKRKLAA